MLKSYNPQHGGSINALPAEPIQVMPSNKVYRNVLAYAFSLDWEKDHEAFNLDPRIENLPRWERA